MSPPRWRPEASAVAGGERTPGREWCGPPSPSIGGVAVGGVEPGDVGVLPMPSGAGGCAGPCDGALRSGVAVVALVGLAPAEVSWFGDDDPGKQSVADVDGGSLREGLIWLCFPVGEWPGGGVRSVRRLEVRSGARRSSAMPPGGSGCRLGREFWCGRGSWCWLHREFGCERGSRRWWRDDVGEAVVVPVGDARGMVAAGWVPVAVGYRHGRGGRSS